ncbi:hypothetical protein INT48_006829 [Thamnidium elegans]|uniref:SWIM-type domain-containing protein n=1 Tax=Thamnidium elegans TaxID=101142 RepID=A0A8H7SIV5_9FUNG|nr:hypothetical protein INT48_006829 [Thamnidium elegans]
MDVFKDFDVLWLQSTPAIAALFYHKYLRDSHALYCPDDDNEPMNSRHIARFILQVMDSNEKKKIAVHFMTPCTIKRQETIINFMKKSRKTLSCYCLAIPTTEYQANLLLGWSVELGDPLWKRRCALPLDTEYFVSSAPPTVKSGYSDWTEFNENCVISNEKFSKRGLIVDLTKDMATFNLEEGLCFNKGIDSAVKGLINASNSSPSTMIWIIDECKLYGDGIKNALQERREDLLTRHRKALKASVESFESSLPIYCYILDYFNSERTTLINCLAQIQHRHHICYSNSIILKGVNDDLFAQNNLNIKVVYLNTMAIYNESKWKDMFLTDLKKINSKGLDGFHYISPDTLGIESVPEKYKIPLLTLDNTGPLTISESIGNDGTAHRVSAQSLDVFNKWAKLMMEYIPKDDTTEDEQDVSTDIFERVAQSMTTEKIQSFLNNMRSYEKGRLILDTIFDTGYDLDTNCVTIEARAKISSSTIHYISVVFDPDASIRKGSCDCAVGRSGSCKHFAATLIYFKEHPDRFKLKKPFEWGYSFQSDSTSSSKKRSSQEDESDSNDSKKKKILIEDKNRFSFEGKEKGYDSEATVPYDPESTDKDSSSFNLYGSNSSELHVAVEHEYSVHASGSSDSIGHSSSSATLPSIHSSSSKSLSLNSSSSKKSSYSYPTCTTSSLSGDASLAPVIEESQEQDYSYDEGYVQHVSVVNSSRQSPVYVTAEEGTQAEGSNTRSYHTNDAPAQHYQTSEAPTQPYKYNEDDETQTYDTCEGATQPYDFNEQASTQQYETCEAPTQAYSYNDQGSTQQYDTCEGSTQQYVESALSSYHAAATQPYDYEEFSLQSESQTMVTTRHEVIEVFSSSSGHENKIGLNFIKLTLYTGL